MTASFSPMACALASALLTMSASDRLAAAEHGLRHVDAQARCHLVFAAMTLPGTQPLSYDSIDANAAPAVLEAAMPYCGVKVMWYLVGQRIAAGELDDALCWLLLARARTLLERMGDPRTFADEQRWRFRRLDRLYGAVLDPYRASRPDVEREQLERAMRWNRLYPSLAYPPAQWPGLHATLRARLDGRLKELEALE